MTHRPSTDTARWQAVVQRDGRQDGAFVYAVRTTGVYCRPSCPSRRPKRENVAFYTTADAATEAGYRPCRRCRPHAESGTPTERTVHAAREFLDAHVNERVSLARLARAVGQSPWHLQRAFSRTVGLSPKAYHHAQQRERLKQALKAPGGTVNRATYDAGMGSPSRVYARADADLGMTPGQYRRGARNALLRFGTTDTAVGRVLVAATDRGVASVALGASDAELTKTLAADFPQATFQRDDRAVAPWLDAIRASIEAGDSVADVPLDTRGTDFQLKVWRALRQIPSGTTRTYSDVAKQIGQPSAVRAVAHACATNPVSLIVPCHRVVRRDGSMGGYRWGIDRKRDLLKRERRT